MTCVVRAMPVHSLVSSDWHVISIVLALDGETLYNSLGPACACVLMPISDGYVAESMLRRS